MLIEVTQQIPIE